MEVLSDILKFMRVEGSVYFCDMLDAPWTKAFQDTTSASFHMIRRGECWATVGDESEYLGPGDLIFIGPGIDHVLASHPPGEPEKASAPCTLLLCGYCDFLDDASTPLLRIFPSLTVIRDEDLQRHPFLKGTFDQLSAEFMARGPGSELIVNKLTEVVLIELIRINFARDADNPFLKALDDKQVSRSLKLLHERPEQHWTIESLAQDVGLSRAAFAKRFKDLVGETVFQYLTNLRMQRGKELLRETGMPVWEVAERVGYESDLAFTRTFRKLIGTTPRQYRLKES